MDETDGDDYGLPPGVLARIDVHDVGVHVVLRHGMTADEFSDMLHLIADSFPGAAHRVDVNPN